MASQKLGWGPQRRCGTATDARRPRSPTANYAQYSSLHIRAGGGARAGPRQPPRCRHRDLCPPLPPPPKNARCDWRGRHHDGQGGEGGPRAQGPALGEGELREKGRKKHGARCFLFLAASLHSRGLPPAWERVVLRARARAGEQNSDSWESGAFFFFLRGGGFTHRWFPPPPSKKNRARALSPFPPPPKRQQRGGGWAGTRAGPPPPHFPTHTRCPRLESPPANTLSAFDLSPKRKKER